MDITKLRKNCLFVGRGSTAIYLILKSLFKNKEVILPSNICYAAIYPVIYSENIPVFVDVNIKTGNATYSEIIKSVNNNTGAIIFPYMYGNVSEDIYKLKKYCEKNKIVLIEDCASAMGATINNNPVGTIGDYAIFSTGHAKIVDVGNGGLLLTDYDIKKISELYKQLPYFNKKIENAISSFSKDYRVLRNKNNKEEMINFFKKDYQDLFLYKVKLTTVNKMKNAMFNLETILQNRKNKYNLFLKNLNNSKNYDKLVFNEESVPWRFTIILKDKEKRKDLIEILLTNNLFVSDWYPCTAKYFDNKFYPISEEMEEKILNFSLTEEDEKIIKTCNIINDYFKE